MNTQTEPEWWSKKEITTLIKVLNNAGSPWQVDLEHNGKKNQIPKDWLRLHINGGAVRIYGIDITRKIQKWVENVFRYNSWNGRLERVTAKDSDNTPLPHLELSLES